MSHHKTTPAENAEQLAGVRLLQLAGFQAYTLSQGYRSERGGTRQTPGLPDVYALHPQVGALWWEVKSETGTERLSQVVFRENAVACGLTILTGPAEAVRVYLRSIEAIVPGALGIAELMRAGWAVRKWPAGYPKQRTDHRIKGAA